MFIATQPIFTPMITIYGYELLFRDEIDATCFKGRTSSSATASVLSNLYEQGINNIVGGSRAFVNFDYNIILSDAMELFDPRTLVIEVLETVEVDDILIERLKYLKRKGFMIALDDFHMDERNYPLLPLVDIIKWDILATPLNTILEEITWAIGENITILAEKVETELEFIQAKDLGFHLFQGFFFSKPKIVGKPNPVYSKPQYSLILEELGKEEPSYFEIAKIIGTDVHLAYRLIRVSSYDKEEQMISSISKALVRMGLTSLKTWINILMLQDLSKGKPLELLRVSLIRSKFSEFIATQSNYFNDKDEIAMMSLFSMIDVMLDSTMEEALQGISLTEEIFDALVYVEGKFKPICYLVYFYEKADWKRVTEYANLININEEELSKGYLESLKWTSKVFESLYG